MHWFLVLLQSLFANIEPVLVWGKVVSPNGSPVAFAQVFLVAEPPFGKGETLRLQTPSDGEGQFRFQLQHPVGRSAFIIARKSGFGLGWTKVSLAAPVQCTVRLNLPARLSGTLQPPEPGKKLMVRGLRPMGVFDDPSPPLMLDAALDFLQSQTDKNGGFSFSGLPEGYVAVLELSGPPCRFEVPVEEGLQLRLTPTGTIVGKAIKRDSRVPLPDAKVELLPADAAQNLQFLSAVPTAARVTAGSDGQFRLVVPEGEWVVWLPAGGDAEWVSEPQVVAVKRGSTVSVVVQGGRPGIVRGWVADATTRFPLTQLFVRAQLMKRPFVSSEVDRQLPEGAYELRLPEGVWRLRVADEGWQSEPVTVEVAEGAVVEAPFIFVRPFPTVRVTVTDEKGKPVKAWLADDRGNIGRTDEQGKAIWSVPPDRPIRLVATTDLKSWASALVTAGQREVRLQLLPGKVIWGKVTTKDGKPVAQARVGLWVMWREGKAFPCLQTQRTQADGTFRFFAPADSIGRVRLVGKGSDWQLTAEGS